jgi:hypothetical protein
MYWPVRKYKDHAHLNPGKLRKPETYKKKLIPLLLRKIFLVPPSFLPIISRVETEKMSRVCTYISFQRVARHWGFKWIPPSPEYKI